MTQWILTSCLLILAVLLIRAVGKDKLSARVRYALWALVLLRLLVPGSFGATTLSVLNYVPERETIQQTQQNPEPYMERVQASEQSDLPVVSDTADTSHVSELSDMSQTTQTVVATQPSESTAQSETTERSETTRLGLDVPMLLWAAGMILVGGAFALSNLRFWAKLRRSRMYLLTETLPVYETAAIETPCMFGFFRPAVYVTPDVLADETALRHVLAHELTHYRHKDHIWSLLRCVCVTLHWYNPLVWVAAYISQQDAELACDEGALKHIGEDERTAYARTLLDLTCVGYKGMLTTATSMTGSESDLKTRVLRIVKNPKMPKIAIPIVLVLALVVALVMFTGEKEAVAVNGVWRSEVVRDDLGSEYAPYVFEEYSQYELKNGRGRRTDFLDGEVELSVVFTYTVRGDEIKISVEEPPYWNPEFEPYTQTLRIDGDTLVENADTEDETIFYSYALQEPVFLSDELFDVEYAESWELGKERRADFEFDAYNAQLLKLFREAEVTVLEDAANETLDNLGYFYNFKNTNLYLADGVLYGEDDGYLLSNIKEIEYLLSSMRWEFTEPGVDGYGMEYYNGRQIDMINIYLTFSHAYREQRYYVPGNQSEWEDAIQEVYDHGTPQRPASIQSGPLLDHQYKGFSVLGGEQTIYVYPGGIFSFYRIIQNENEEQYYREDYFVTAEQAPKLSKLMENFINLYEDSMAIGPKDDADYNGTWVLTEPLGEYGITDMILKMNLNSDYFSELYTLSYSSKVMAKQNGDLLSEDAEMGIMGEELMMLFRDGTEYRFPYSLEGDRLTIDINGVEATFRRATVSFDDYTDMGDIVLIPSSGYEWLDVILMSEEDKETFISLIITGLSAKQETENIIVKNKEFYYVPVMNEPLDAEQVILSDMGTIHFQGEAYYLTNWDEITVFLDKLNLQYSKAVDLYPKG